MQLTVLDIVIIVCYLIATVGIGFWVSSRASKNIRSYFLGGNKLKWYMLGLSNASGMFDISGTMWMVYLLFVYGLTSVFIPWLWPTFNQIFMMVFLSVWLRRSGVLTGAEWITFRFGNGLGARLSHLIVVIFALVNVVGFLAYGFIGIGKFASVFLPWQLSPNPDTNDIYYGLIITALTTVYVVKGGMFSVVFSEVLQFIIMTAACISVGVIAMHEVSPDMLAAAVPDNWMSLSFGWNLDIDWSGKLASANAKIAADGYSPFSLFFMLMLLSGILKSLMGPAPNYDMQRVLSTRSPAEAAKMSGFVNVALLFPRYMLITGLTVLALVHFTGDLKAMGDNVDFEQILPFAMKNFIPPGLLGLLIAGLLAAFMSTFAATTNAAPAYLVNDIYKRYFKPEAEAKTYVKVSYIVSVVFVILGVSIGLFVPSLNAIILWIVSAFYGAYTASNLLKWFWWRFNGIGYFCGMAAGMVILVAIQLLQWTLNISIMQLYAFPYIFSGCFIACVVGSLLSKPDDIEVLKTFYIKVRPWGFWGPVYREALKEHPELQHNKDFYRDCFNLVVGVIWQTSMIVAAIFLVIQQWDGFILALVITAFSSTLLWQFWWKKLQSYPEDTPKKYLPKLASKV